MNIKPYILLATLKACFQNDLSSHALRKEGITFLPIKLENMQIPKKQKKKKEEEVWCLMM